MDPFSLAKCRYPDESGCCIDTITFLKHFRPVFSFSQKNGLPYFYLFTDVLNPVQKFYTHILPGERDVL